MAEENNKFLGEEKVSKLLLKFSIPCILSLLISSLYNMADQIFIGNSSIGYLGNAATNVVFPLTIISCAFAWAFGDGAAAYLSICQGKKDTKNAHKAIANSILFTFIISLIFTIIGFTFMNQVLSLFGASDASIGLAKDYFTIILSFIPIYMLGNVVNGVIRADGAPLVSMVATLTGAILNIILDPLFIFGFDMGIQGAAWATIIGQCATFVISYLYLFKTKTFKLKLESFKPCFSVFKNVIKLGVSTFITQMAIVIISLVCNIMLVRYGSSSKYGQDIPIAVVGIAMKVFSIVINIVVGIIVGGQPILGYNYGAKKYDRVKETFTIVAKLTILVGIIATIAFLVFPKAIISIFGNESGLYNEFAVLTFRIFLCFVSFTCFVKMTSIFFQAVGQPVKAIVISLVRDIVCFVPLVLILPNFFGIKGVLYAAPIADFVGLIVTIPAIIIFFKSLEMTENVKTEQKVVLKPSKHGVIITIARKHGSQGKFIGELVSKKLNIPYYYKEVTALAAKESGLAEEYVSKLNQDSPNFLYDLYVSTTPVQEAIKAQDTIIKKIAEQGSCVIVGRAADYILRDHDNVVKIFIYANEEYRTQRVMEMYHDTKEQARKSIQKSDKARANYYKTISGKNWEDVQNYDFCVDSSIGVEKTAELIVQYIKNMDK